MKATTFSSVCKIRTEVLARDIYQKPGAMKSSQRTSIVQGTLILRGNADATFGEVFCQIEDLRQLYELIGRN